LTPTITPEHMRGSSVLGLPPCRLLTLRVRDIESRKVGDLLEYPDLTETPGHEESVSRREEPAVDPGGIRKFVELGRMRLHNVSVAQESAVVTGAGFRRPLQRV